MNIAFGVDPWVNTMTVMGLHNCKLLMDYVFYSSGLGPVIFVIGTIKGVVESNLKEEASYKKVWIFWVMYMLLATTTAGFSINLGDSQSKMEQRGYTGVTTQKLLNGSEWNAGKVLASNPGEFGGAPLLVGCSRYMDALIFGAIEIVTFATRQGEAHYFKSPFYTQKLYLSLSKDMAKSIKNVDLKDRMQEFMHKYYLPSLSILINTTETDQDSMSQYWPGSELLLSNYSDKGLAEWSLLRKELLDYVRYEIKFFDRIKLIVNTNRKFEGELDGEDLENEIIINFFKNEIRDSAGKMTNSDYYGANKQASKARNVWQNWVGAGLAHVGTVVQQPISLAVMEGMMRVLPMVQGFIIYLMFTFFPVSVIFALLERSSQPLTLFVKFLFWIKSLSLTWAICQYASVYVLQMHLAFSPGANTFLDSMYFNIAFNSFLVMSPMISMVFVKGHMQGAGMVMSAVTLNMSKAAEAGKQLATTVGSKGMNKIAGLNQ